VFKVALMVHLIRLSTFRALINYSRSLKEDLKTLSSFKFTVSFITNPFQERDVSENAEPISYVFKENVSELKLEIINFQTGLSLETRVDDTDV
jgi:hypothetical protein